MVPLPLGFIDLPTEEVVGSAIVVIDADAYNYGRQFTDLEFSPEVVSSFLRRL